MYGVYRSWPGYYRARAPFAPLAAAAAGATGSIAATLVITASVSGAHGVAGTAAATLGISAAISAAHGVAGSIAAPLVIQASITGVIPVSVTVAAVLKITADIEGLAGDRLNSAQPLRRPRSVTALPVTGTDGRALILGTGRPITWGGAPLLVADLYEAASARLTDEVGRLILTEDNLPIQIF